MLFSRVVDNLKLECQVAETMRFRSPLLVYFLSALSFVSVLFSTSLPAAETPLKLSQDGLNLALFSAATEHPSAKAKLDELNALRLDLDSEKAQRYPTLSLQAQAMTEDQSQMVVQLRQPIWVGGRIDESITLSEIKLEIGELELLNTQRQLMEDAAATYALLYGARQRLLAAELNVEEHEKLKALISRRKEGGISSDADIRLALSRLARAVSQREQLSGLVSRGLIDLQALTQITIRGEEPVPIILFSDPNPADIIVQIENVSPVVKQRKTDVLTTRSQEKLSQAEMLPSLFAQIDLDVITANNNNRETRIGLVLESNLEGVGFVGWKRVKSAGVRVTAAERTIETARIEVRRSAQGLLSDRDVLKRIQRSNMISVAAAQDTLASFMRQYDAGRKTWVDVLNAQKEFADARLLIEQTKSSLQEAELRLFVQLGHFDALLEDQSR